MSSDATDPTAVLNALADLGQDATTRHEFFEILRRAEARAADRVAFRDCVRWPLICAALSRSGTHRVSLRDGLVFDVTLDSRIERALLLSAEAHPDHVWEPQTTKLVVALGGPAEHAIIGGAYIGDQALPIARAMGDRGKVHAFEPMAGKLAQLNANVALNHLLNVTTHRMALWDESGLSLDLTGDPALANCAPATAASGAEAVTSITIDDYVARAGLASVGLIMLDLEGGEEKALRGAAGLLGRAPDNAPSLVFETHRDYVDWSGGLAGTPLVRYVSSFGYQVFAVRDYHDNRSMVGHAIEIIPLDAVYLEGPSHGFNLLAIKRPELIAQLGLKVVRNVSPKLLLHKDPTLHAPLDR